MSAYIRRMIRNVYRFVFPAALSAMAIGVSAAELKPVLKPVLKAPPPELILATGGKLGCVLLAPADPAWQAAAARIAQALERQFGAQPPVVAELTGSTPTAQTVIALGKMSNNPLIEHLYWNRRTLVDSLIPGGDGFVIQTVKNPGLPGVDRDVLVIGASSPAGAERAADFWADKLPTLLKEGSLAPLLHVELPEKRAVDYIVSSRSYSKIAVPGAPLTPDDAKALVDAPAQPTLLAFHDLALKYLLTGEEPYLAAAKKVLEVMTGVYAAAPNRPPTWPEECNSFYIFTMWDAVGRAPLFSPAERQRYAEMLFLFLKSVAGKVTDYRNVDKQPIIHNHQSFPLLGIFAGARYFLNNCELSGDDQKLLREYLRKADDAFTHQSNSWKPLCDADHYVTLTIGHTMLYNLASGRTPFFDNRNARRYAEYVMAICDNQGRAAGFGDSGLWRDTTIADAGVPPVFGYTRDPRLLGYLNLIHQGNWPNPYDQTIEPQPPENIVGVKAFPMSREQYDFRSYGGAPTAVPNIPFAEAFDKISFRQNLDPDGQYFILDGYSRGVHMHFDGNAILKLTSRQQDWLIDADYLKNNSTEHNMVSVLRDGRAAKPPPECAGIVHLADLPAVALTETRVTDYNGIDWRRNLIWEKGGFLAVFDLCRAREAGQYTLDCVFKTLDLGTEALISPECFRITRAVPAKAGADAREPYSLYIINADGARQTTVRRLATPGPVKKLVQRQNLFLQSGEETAFLNLLHFASGQEDQPPAVRRLGPAAVIADLDAPVLLGIGSFRSKAISIDAARFAVRPDRISLAEATGLTLGQAVFRSDDPVSVELDLRQRRATIIADRPTAVMLAGSPEKRAIAAGRTELPLADSRELERQLDSALRSLPPAAATSQSAAAGTAAETLAARLRWELKPGVDPVNAFTAVDLDRDGGKELLVCRGRELQCYSADGRMRWSFAAKGVLRAVITADLKSDGKLSILCGGEDETLSLLTPDGRLRQEYRFTEHLVTGQGGTPAPFVNCLLVDDLDGDGSGEIMAGLSCSQLTVLDAGLRKLWNADTVYHAAGALRTAELNGDGFKEILISDHYGSVHVFDRTGKKLAYLYSQTGDISFDLGDFDGSGKPTVVNASSGGGLKAFAWPPRERFNFFNYGYGFNAVKIGDLDGDGRPETVAAGEAGYLYVLDTGGKVVWQLDCSDEITALALNDAPGVEGRIAIGQRNGRLSILSAAGKALASDQAGGRITQLQFADLDGDGRPELIAVDELNRLTVLEN